MYKAGVCTLVDCLKLQISKVIMMCSILLAIPCYFMNPFYEER
jgi:hypothetical protein